MLLEIIETKPSAKRKFICCWCEEVPRSAARALKDSERNYGMCRTCLAGRRSQLRKMPQRAPLYRCDDVPSVVADEVVDPFRTPASSAKLAAKAEPKRAVTCSKVLTNSLPADPYGGMLLASHKLVENTHANESRYDQIALDSDHPI